jgi:hypothetical protein
MIYDFSAAQHGAAPLLRFSTHLAGLRLERNSFAGCSAPGLQLSQHGVGRGAVVMGHNDLVV